MTRFHPNRRLTDEALAASLAIFFRSSHARILERSSRLAIAAGLALVVGGCGSSDTGCTTPGTIALSITPVSSTIQQGGSTVVTGTVTRGGGFTGDVAIGVSGAPAGVTGTVTLAPTGGASSLQVTLAVGSSVTPGVYPLTVHATGSGVTEATAPFALTVSAATPASFTMAATPATFSIAQSGSATSNVSFVRTNFTGNIALTAENLPAGVNAVVTTSPVVGNAATVTFNVSGAAIPGTHNGILLRGTATGLTDVTAPITLSITATGNFTIAATPATISMLQRSTGTTLIKATRTGGFTGALTFTVTNATGGALPTGLSGAVTSTATADTYTLTATAVDPLVAGVYNVLVTANSPGVAPQSAAVAITVTQPGLTAHLDFSACDPASRPIWFAYQDASGPWTTVTPVGNVYTFNVVGAKAGYAYVTAGSTSFYTRVNYIAINEVPSAVATCATGTTAGKTVNGSFTGITASDRANISFASFATGLRLPNSTFQFTSIPNGSWDLIGYRRNDVSTGLDRMLIRRDQDIANGGSLALMDFNGSEAVITSAAQIILSGVAPTDPITQTMYYYTGAECDAAALLYTQSSTGQSALINGWPTTAPQRATDLHAMQFTSFNGANGRGVSLSTHALASRTLPMLAYPTATVTPLGTTYKRLNISVPVGPDYDNGFVIYYDNSAAHNVVVSQSTGYLGGATTGTFLMPDLTAATGFLASWEPAVGASTQWSVNLQSALWGARACTEGAVSRYVTVTGAN